MNKQSITKINFFLQGLQGRFQENINLFKQVTVTYKSGLKQFKGMGILENDSIRYNFNGRDENLDFNTLCNKICDECSNYDSVTILFQERGSDFIINGDNKNVKINTKETKEDILDSHYDSSSLLNRDYLIKAGKANELLKAIGIMSKDGKIKNDKIRKYNQIDHYVELLDKTLSTLKSNETLTILDCGCGKSYLSFVLNYYLTEVKKQKCHFIGLDISKQVIEASRNIANTLGYRNMDFIAMDIKNYRPNKKINVIMSLHACDTATDMALALGIKLKSDCIIAVPCCHRELLSQYSYEPFKSITKNGILKARLADTLTDGMRGMMLEAKGYDVSIVEYISPLETPKNLMIRAIFNGKEKSSIYKEYLNLCSQFNANPALLRFLDEQWES